MTRDYAKKPRASSARKPRPKSQVPAWVWLFTGSVLGAFIMFLVYLAGLAPGASDGAAQPLPTAPVVTETPPPAETDEDQTVPKPRFDFYKLLQESEVIVPATEPATSAEADTAADPAFEYILQVGSFRRVADADNLRAQLILLNLEARTEAVTIRDGEQWHRVVVGPFDTQSKLAKARSTLVSNQYNALVLKRKL